MQGKMVESGDGKKGDSMTGRPEIFTGYYANVRRYVAGGCALVRISVGLPKFLKDGEPLPYVRQLAPHYGLLSIEDEAEYTRRFKAEILARADYARTMDEIGRIAAAAGKSRVVLLCFEKPPKFCHRSLVAEWINSHGQCRVTEYGYSAAGQDGAAGHTPKIVQPDLFAEAGIEIREPMADWR